MLPALHPGVQAQPAVALFYGARARLDELKAFDIVVVDPDHQYDPQRYRKPIANSTLTSPSVKHTRGAAIIATFRRAPEWPSTRTGIRWSSTCRIRSGRISSPSALSLRFGHAVTVVFLDTLDSYRLAKEFDEAAGEPVWLRSLTS